MKRIQAVLVLLGLAFLAQPAVADNLFDKIEGVAKDASDAVVNTGKTVGSAVEDTVTSTENLFSNEDTPEATRAKLDAMSEEVLARLFTEVAGSQALFDTSQGYAVFDTRRVTVFPVTAGGGRGVAVDRETGQRTYMQMGTGGVGAALGIGGFESQMVILFETEDLFLRFVTDGYDASAEAEMKVDEDVTQQTLRFENGRRVFVLGKRGWRVAASVGGTKYWRDPQLN